VESWRCPRGQSEVRHAFPFLSPCKNTLLLVLDARRPAGEDGKAGGLWTVAARS
jgi:hypothetical protein